MVKGLIRWVLMLENLLEEVKDVEQLFHGDQLREKADQYGIPEDEFLDFSTNVNPLGPPDLVVNYLRENLGKISQYPTHQPVEVRKSLAGYAGVDREEIVLGNGSNELLYLLARVFLGKNDESIVVEPTFTEYSKAVKTQGSETVSVKLNENEDFRLKVDRINNKISKKTKLVFLCSPNNPTGRVVPLEDIENIIEICEENKAILLLDEVFYEYCDYSQKHKISKLDRDNLAILRSFTKFFAFAGLRFGYLIASSPIAKILRNAVPQWNVNILAQLAAEKAIEDSEFISRTKKVTGKGKEYLQEKLEKFNNLKFYPSDANFFLINISDTDFTASELVEKLLSRGIAIRNCSDFKYLDENYVRVNTRPKEDCQKLIENLTDIGLSTD